MAQATTISLGALKKALKMTQDADDEDLTRLLLAATQEALRYMGRRELPTLPLEYPVDRDGDCSSDVITEETPSSEDPVAADVENAIILLAKADYEGDPTLRKVHRDAAETILTPYRIGWGV